MGTDDYRTRDAYQFGHTSLAARRLEVLACVFRPSSESFIRAAAVPGARRVLDLGCGPGYTTQLLAELAPQAEVVGLDMSPEFLAMASRGATACATFASWDLSSGALPAPAADAAFCRFVLSHLSDPLGAISRWGSALAPGGVLLVEEVEAIHAEQPVFRQYLEIVEAMLADQQTRLYIGPALSAAPDPAGLERCFDRVFELAVPRRDAALMFSMNVPNWRDRPFIRERYSQADLDALEAELQSLAESEGGEAVQWKLRQIGWRQKP